LLVNLFGDHGKSSYRKWDKSHFPALFPKIDRFGGADGIRTHGLLDAIEARSQLRHGPTV
jgi:hypothetical protein